MRRQQPCIGLMVRTPDAATQLMKLCQTEMIRAFNDDGVGQGRDIDPGLNVVVHRTLKRWWWSRSSPVPARARAFARDRWQYALPAPTLPGGLPLSDIFHVVVEVIDLTAAQHLTQMASRTTRLSFRAQRFHGQTDAPAAWR